MRFEIAMRGRAANLEICAVNIFRLATRPCLTIRFDGISTQIPLQTHLDCAVQIKSPSERRRPASKCFNGATLWHVCVSFIYETVESRRDYFVCRERLSVLVLERDCRYTGCDEIAPIREHPSASYKAAPFFPRSFVKRR